MSENLPPCRGTVLTGVVLVVLTAVVLVARLRSLPAILAGDAPRIHPDLGGCRFGMPDELVVGPRDGGSIGVGPRDGGSIGGVRGGERERPTE